MLSVTKKFEFEAAHFLEDYEGKCSSMHGHTFKMEIEIAKGDVVFYKNDDMIIDFGHLKKIVTEDVIEKLDHKCLNDVLPSNPTSENLVQWIAEQLYPFFGEQLIRVRLYETTNSYAEWRK